MSMPCTSVKSLVVMTTSGSSVSPDRSRAATPSLSMHACHCTPVSISKQLHLGLLLRRAIHTKVSLILSSPVWRYLGDAVSRAQI